MFFSLGMFALVRVEHRAKVLDEQLALVQV